MGRPLKIRKVTAAASPDGSVDLGYPTDGTTDNGYDTNVPGVVGGVTTNDTVRATVAVKELALGPIYATVGENVLTSTYGSDLQDRLNNGYIAAGTQIFNSDGTYIGSVTSPWTNRSTATTTSSNAGTDAILVDDTSNMTEGVAVTFDDDIGGLTAGTVYFVHTVVDGTHFKVSETQYGTLKQLTTDTVTTGVNVGVTIFLDSNAEVSASDSSYLYFTEDNGFIIRQKGKKKFLVARQQNTEDEFIVTGGTYYISDLQNTDWAALGAGPDASVGKVFTAIIDGTGLGTNGRVYPVAVCTLVDGSPSINEMFIEVYNNGNTTNAAVLTNHWVRDFDNDAIPLDNDANNTKYAASLYNDNGDTVPDPAAALDKVWTIVAVENWC